MELGYYCNQSNIDIINIAFITPFPQQTGGLPGANFGNQCGSATYAHSGGDLPSSCPYLQNDLPYCQKEMGKKIILSIGGGVLSYQLNGAQAGADFATMLWQMYGPYNATYVAGGGVRPLDRSSTNSNPDPYYQIDVDGFDFDIEAASTGRDISFMA
jgi:chitinase